MTHMVGLCMVDGAGIVPDRVTVTRHGMSFISVPGGRLTQGRRRPVGGPWGLPEIPVGNSPGSVEPVVRVSGWLVKRGTPHAHCRGILDARHQGSCGDEEHNDLSRKLHGLILFIFRRFDLDRLGV
jgi:hypothetical protein